MNKRFELSKISDIIKKSKTFFIAGHIKPDGDSLGAACAVSLRLNRMNKKAEVYCLDPIPREICRINGISKIKSQAPKNKTFDCAIILESSDLARMGDIIDKSQAKKIINIDHHQINSMFGDANYVVANSSSVSELVIDVFDYMGIKMKLDEAENLYIGLMTDTGRFQNSNVNENSHAAAAKLIKAGVSPSDLVRCIYSNETVQSLKLLAKALENTELLFDGQLAYSTLTKNNFKQTGAKDSDSGGIVNYLLSIGGVKAACLLKEEDKNTVKASLRSVKSFDLLDIVKKFGGGGHKNAAGATLNGNIKTALALIKNSFAAKFGDTDVSFRRDASDR